MEIDKSDVRDFFIKETGSETGLVEYTKLEKEFGKKNAYRLHERGMIYEPILGKAKLI